MRRTFVSLWAAALLTALTSAPAAAATLRLAFTDLDVKFEGPHLNDATDSKGGEKKPEEADPLGTLEFYVDGVRVGSLSNNIWADLAIINVDPIPVSGGAANAYGGTLDILFGPGQGITLDLFDIELFLFGGNGSLSGSATAGLFEQILVPFGVVFDPNEPIDVVFALGPLMNTKTSNGFLTYFEAEGTGSIRGQGTGAVPEPASLILLGTGLFAAAAAKRRARH